MSPAVLKASSATRDHSLHSLTLQLHTLSNAVVVKVNFMVPLYYILIGDYFYLINFFFIWWLDKDENSSCGNPNLSFICCDY